MNRRHVTLSAVLVLAACQPPGGEPVAESEPEARGAASASEAGRPIEAGSPATPQSLVGEYRVAGIDGEPLDAPIGLAVSIDLETIKLAPCAGLIWSYTYAGGMIETRRAPPPEGGIVCRITPEAAAAGEAIDAATSARRTAANGIELAGTGHSVVLFSQ